MKALLNREQLKAAYEIGGPVKVHRQIGDYTLVEIDGYTVEALGVVDEKRLVELLLDARAKGGGRRGSEPR
jgi:hypothetical protein